MGSIYSLSVLLKHFGNAISWKWWAPHDQTGVNTAGLCCVVCLQWNLKFDSGTFFFFYFKSAKLTFKLTEPDFEM